MYRSFDGGDFELFATLNLTDDFCVDTGAAAGATLDEGALDQGNYSYYVTYYNSSNNNESRPTSEIGALSVNEVNQRIRIDDIPQPTSGAFDNVRIYRNVSGSTDFYLVDTIPLGETTYIDSKSDAEIEGGPELDLMGPKANSGTSPC